jgi:hypothetical protein
MIKDLLRDKIGKRFMGSSFYFAKFVIQLGETNVSERDLC